MRRSPLRQGGGGAGETLADRQDSEPARLNKNHDVYFVPGLHRGLLVLEMLAAAQRPLGITEIAGELGVTRSSAFRLVYTLKHMGFLEEVGDAKHYRLGSRVLNIGYAYLASRDIIELARPHIEALRDRTEVTAHLAIRDGRDVLYLSCVQTRSGFLSNMNVGARVPAHASPMGWYLLSALTGEALAALYGDAPLAARTEKTPTTPEALAAEVAHAATQPYLVSRGIVEAGGSSIIAPVRDNSGTIVAAIDISGPDSAFDLDDLDRRYAGEVVRAAGQISAMLGYRGGGG